MESTVQFASEGTEDIPNNQQTLWLLQEVTRPAETLPARELKKSKPNRLRWRTIVLLVEGETLVCIAQIPENLHDAHL